MKKLMAIVPFSIIGYHPDKPVLVIEREIVYGEFKDHLSIHKNPNMLWHIYRTDTRQFIGFMESIEGILIEQSIEEGAGITGISKPQN